MSEHTPRVSLAHISKRFGDVVALADVSVELEPGERVALVGENGAGKSSLMNVLYGLYAPDSGSIAFDGVTKKLRTPADAMELGIGMVHQHFTLVPTLTVAENVVLGHESRRGLFIDSAKAADDVRKTCARFGFALEPHAIVSTLTVGSQQKVEIVKALHRGARVLVLDEPTAVLTPQEADELFVVARSLAEQGVTVVLVSHKLTEVLGFASRVVVMRRGNKVAEVKAAETTPAALAQLMVGDVAVPTFDGARAPVRPNAPVVIELQNVDAPKLHQVNLRVRAGEIVGIAGVDGNGQRELAEVLTGLLPVRAGAVKLAGSTIDDFSPNRARALGIAHVPEDRLRRAIAVELTVEENVALGREARPPFAVGARIDREGRRTRAEGLMEAHDVRPRDTTLRMGALSGGNQQKLVVGRELDGQPAVLVVVQPTRGLDIAAVAAVRRHLLAAREGGCAVVLVSLDLDEVLALADRTVVLFEGRVQAEFERTAYDERAIGAAMLGVRA